MRLPTPDIEPRRNALGYQHFVEFTGAGSERVTLANGKRCVEPLKLPYQPRVRDISDRVRRRLEVDVLTVAVVKEGAEWTGLLRQVVSTTERDHPAGIDRGV